MRHQPFPAILSGLVALLLPAVLVAQLGEPIPFGTHEAVHPGSREAGIASMEIERNLAVFTSRLLAADGTPLATLRFQPLEDGSVQIEMTRDGGRWSGEGDDRTLTVTDLETGKETVLTWRAGAGDDGAGRWEAEGGADEAALLLAHGWAESVAALELSAWE